MNKSWNQILFQKLSSRKFWALLAALAVSIATAAGAEADTIERIVGIIGALGSCVVYMLAEAMVDSTRTIPLEGIEIATINAVDNSTH